ncbi:hypothetical protein D3C78_968680 [compost metagenome]
MPEPLAEAPAFTLEVRCDIGRHQGRFNQEGPDTAHRVRQCAAFRGDLRPAGANQDCRGKVLLQRRGPLLQTVAALVQAVPGQVEGQHRLAAIEVQMHADIRVDLVHGRPAAELGAQVVDDGILDLQCAEVSVIDTRAAPAELHRQAAARIQVIAPRDAAHAHVEFLGVRHREPREHHQHPVGQARPEAEAICRFQIALTAHRGNLRPRLLQAERLGLLQQQAIEPLGTGEEQFVDFRHASFPGPQPSSDGAESGAMPANFASQQ